MPSHSHSTEALTALWLIPMGTLLSPHPSLLILNPRPSVPPITVSATGSLLCTFLVPVYPSYALMILITSYIMNGIGILLSLLVLAM
jgi:hypothetical protein